jgi:hypothetical protein
MDKKSTNKNEKVNDNTHCLQHCCYSYIIQKANKINHALTYQDLIGVYTYETLRNTVSQLVNDRKIIKIPKENPARFILPEWSHRPEYTCVIRNDKRSRVGKFDFLSYLERIGWSNRLCVHDLKFAFQVYNSISNKDWEYCKANLSYSKFLSLSYPVRVQLYNTGTVLVNIKCSSKPFPLDINGFSALASLLGEVKISLNKPFVPDIDDWVIVQWHLNRDSERLQGGGLDMYVTFRDFFNDAAQFYYKNSLKVMRAEVVQSPKKTLPEIFENILNRESNSTGAL